MKALVFHRGKTSKNDRMAMDVKLVEQPKPTNIQPGYSLIKVKAIGLNPVDAKYCYGDKLPESLSSLGKYLADGKGVGFDFSGIVENSPNFETSFDVGEEVYGTASPLYGSCKEYVLVPNHQISKKPKNLSFEEAASLPLVGITAIQALNDKRFYDLAEMLEKKKKNWDQGGDPEKLYLLLVGASGGVGHIACQVAKAISPNIIVTAVCSSRNIETVKDLGADHIIDYRKHGENINSFSQEMRQNLSKNNNKFDIVFDTVSSTEGKDLKPFNYRTLIRDQNLLSNQSPYVTIGGSLSEWFKAGLKRTVNLYSFSGNNELFWVRFPYSRGVLERLCKFCEEGKVKPIIGNDPVSLSEESVMGGFEMLHSRRVVGKIVLKGFE